MSIPSKIKSDVAEIKQQLIQIRRHLHQYPELSFEEKNTSQFIQNQLTEWGIPFETGYVKTGILVKLDSGNSEKRLALRADMDALPILEANDCAYKSKHEGVMHACGHDAHSTSLLGALYILNKNKDLWSGKIRAVFQPGEEVLPGGAKLMLEEGVFDIKPEAIFGQHVFPDLEAGQLGFRAGQYMASTDEIHLKVIGQGGHAALPHKLIDPVVITAELISNLQQVVSRKVSPYVPSVLSFGYLSADGASNVIPNEVKLIGTFRCMDETWRKKAHDVIRSTCEHICKAHGASCELDIRVGYPSLTNDENLAQFAKSKAIEFVGADQVVDLELRMTAEDFAYYTQVMPGCFYRFGTAEKGQAGQKKLHHPKFDIDEDALETSTGFMAYLALSYLV
ncbi:MAG: M20 metallopeptidase family protein [Flavobacteriales bacterium]